VFDTWNIVVFVEKKNSLFNNDFLLRIANVDKSESVVRNLKLKEDDTPFSKFIVKDESLKWSSFLDH